MSSEAIHASEAVVFVVPVVDDGDNATDEVGDVLWALLKSEEKCGRKVSSAYLSLSLDDPTCPERVRSLIDAYDGQAPISLVSFLPVRREDRDKVFPLLDLFSVVVVAPGFSSLQGDWWDAAAEQRNSATGSSFPLVALAMFCSIARGW